MRIPRPRLHHLAVAGLLALLAAASLLLPGRVRGEAPVEMPTTYSTEPGGLQGLYMTCEGLGIDVSRWTDRLDGLDPAEVPVLAVVGRAEPSVDPVPLAAWVEAGGTLLLASREDRLLGLFGIAPGEGLLAPRRIALLGRAGSWDLPGEVPVPAEPIRAPAEVDGEVLVRAEGESGARVLAAVLERGAGRVVYLAEPSLLVNRAFEDPARAVLALRLVEEAARDGAVSFCETIHGFGGEGSPQAAMARILRRTPFGNAALGAAFFLLLALVADAGRFGRVRRTLEAPRRSEYEYLDALAGLLVASKAWGRVSDLLLLGVRRRIGREALPGGRGRSWSVAEALSWDRPADADVLRAAEEAVDSGGDPATMARGLAALDAALPPERPRGGRGASTTETP